ncbi:hypothetical protein [Bradyrhizobium iriomotense]|uniref:hypothetical protein n=1 Tax=Bradyrhizobium iriomotense TaxID=441950 RepID=UPI0032E000AC
MPQPRHSLCQIGCGNQWHQRSAGAADVPRPVDLEWPRRATVGAIVVIGVTDLFGEKSDDCAVIDSPSNTGLSLVNSICEAVTTQMRLQTSKREGRFAVDKVRRLRAMSSLCRQQAAYNSMNKWKLLAEAEYWDHLAELALSSHFQQCNAITSTNDVEPKTISA